MLPTLTAFTSVVLRIAENTRAAAQGQQVYHTLAAHTCLWGGEKPLWATKRHPLPSPSTRARAPHTLPGCAGIHFPCGKSWTRRLRFPGRTHAPCLECWQCLPIPALALMARTLQSLSASPELHPQAWQLLHQRGCRILSFPKRPAHTRGISLSVSGIISWAISVCAQEQWASLCACGATGSPEGLEVPPTAPHCTQHTLKPTCGIFRPGCSQNSLVYQHEEWCHFDK